MSHPDTTDSSGRKIDETAAAPARILTKRSAERLRSAFREAALAVLEMDFETPKPDSPDALGANFSIRTRELALALLPALETLETHLDECGLLADVASVNHNEPFEIALRDIERQIHAGAASGDASAPEKRRFKIMEESVALLRGYLEMDYVGMWLFKNGERIAVHESGRLHALSSWAAINDQIKAATAVQETGDSRIYLCPSDSEEGGVDAVLLFRNLDGTPIGCLLLDDYSTEREIDGSELSKIMGIFYNRLHLIIEDEANRIANREIEQVRSELEVMQRELINSQYDHLTGLPKREIGIPQFRRVLETVRRSREGSCVSVVIFDADHFKRVNDTMGHNIGDDVLRGIGRVFLEGYPPDSKHDHRIVNAPRGSDLVFRFGGEEFIAIFPETDAIGAKVVTDRFRDAISQLEFKDGKGGTFQVTMTAGICEIRTKELRSLPRETDAVTYVIEQADRALYQGKAGGRNQSVIWQGLDPETDDSEGGSAD